MVAEGSSEGGARRSQNIARARRRRRRPNIDGPKHTIEVVLSADEFATVRAAADEAGMTVPWYLVQSAVNPVPAATASASGKAKPWLPWPKRQTLAALLVSATGALDEVRLEHLAKIGGNLNQIAHAANISGTVADEVLDTVEELRETLGELRERAARMEELAREVTRR
ncbi:MULTISPECIES: MobC family plasmid mobilization relaxosome protein [unclassified Nocardia]|uniref:MobC family plasmid mobilization relaxosome protein n=1 Tax=unclassified Nocardia TaxID=2637762 RepID=UPI00278C19DF|nr:MULTISPECIES: MobC family plasmid mobilization relaxosome protein [unclassified Nocardia]